MLIVFLIYELASGLRIEDPVPIILAKAIQNKRPGPPNSSLPFPCNHSSFFQSFNQAAGAGSSVSGLSALLSALRKSATNSSSSLY